MEKVQILIVKDEAIVSMDLRYKLEAMGYSVVAEISSGEEAVDAASQLHPDVVLMDIGLSGEMDGIDAAAQIRSRSDIPHSLLRWIHVGASQQDGAVWVHSQPMRPIRAPQGDSR